ncbi:MAG: hypothetical protein ACRDWG_11985, partial [Actinomycetes bacterium]
MPADLPADRRRQEHDVSDSRGGGHGFAVPAGGRHTARTIGARSGVSVPAAGPGRPLIRDDSASPGGREPGRSDGGRQSAGPVESAPAVLPGTGRRRRVESTEPDPSGDIDLFGRGHVPDSGDGEPDTLTGRGVRALLSSLGPRRGARPTAAGA